jgi:hypothetical protein
MLNNDSRMWLVGGLWAAAVATIVACSVAVGASVSSTAVLCVLCSAPLGVALIIGFGAPSPTVAELLYAVNSRKEGRR